MRRVRSVRLLSAAVLVGVLSLPAAADASVVWNPVTFVGGGTHVRVPAGAPIPAVSGSVRITDSYCADAVHQFSVGEYVRRNVVSRAAIYNTGHGGSGASFTHSIAPGPSRKIQFAYFENVPGACGYVGSPDTLTVESVARPTLSVDPGFVRNGKRVSFSGTLVKPFVEGRPTIALQARVRKKKWRTFKAVPVAADGSFVGRYRFTRTPRTTVYKFRAKALVGGVVYPFTTRPSRKERVLVRP